MKKIRIGTRDSKLALVQAEMVKQYLEEHTNSLVTLISMKTTGDKILDKPLDKIGGKGLFMKELDMALEEGRSDLSVHSLKDVTMELPEEFPILGVSKREDPRDVLVLPRGVKILDLTKPIGCSSKRRILQFQKLYPEAVCKSVRGNVPTRIEKLDHGEYSALILAAAGLKRLGLENRISRYFTEEEIIPAAGQGIIAIQGRKDMNVEMLAGFFDKSARIEAEAERAYVSYLNGGCFSPIAAHAKVSGERIRISGLYYDESIGEEYITGSIAGNVQDAEKLGIELAKVLRFNLERTIHEKRKSLVSRSRSFR